MAGIGFKLRRMVDQGTFAGFLQGYLYSAIISAGPWLISIATLGTIAGIAGGISLPFSTAIVYVYSFTLIFVGPFQFTATRYVSDRLYAGDTHAHIPAFLTTWCASVLPQTVLFYAYMLCLDATPGFRLQAAVLYMIVASVWVVLIFLGVVKAYRLVILSFLAGSGASILFTALLRHFSPQVTDASLLAAYTAGQAMVLLVLLWVLFSEFDIDRVWDRTVMTYALQFPWLTMAGLTYYAGMWMDKIVYRYSAIGKNVAAPLFNAAPDYETAAFLAQLTAIPALAIFFLRVETEFFDRFSDYYQVLQNKGSLARIEEAHQAMVDSLKTGARKIITVQGLLAAIAVLLAPILFRQLVEVDANVLPLLRIQIVAVFFQTLMFMVSVVLMYYEFHKESCATMGLFMALNLILTIALLPLGNGWNGIGYLVSAISSSALGIVLLVRRLHHLEFITFVRQPVSNLVTLPPERRNTGEAVGEYTYVRKSP